MFCQCCVINYSDSVVSSVVSMIFQCCFSGKNTKRCLLVFFGVFWCFSWISASQSGKSSDFTQNSDWGRGMVSDFRGGHGRAILAGLTTELIQKLI